MARPSKAVTTRRPPRTKALEKAKRADALVAGGDALTAAALVNMRRYLAARFHKDADFWYAELRKFFTEKSTREDSPKANLLREVLRTFLAEQRIFPMKNDAQAPPPPTQLNMIVQGNVTLERGTKEARDAAREVDAKRRAILVERTPKPVGTGGIGAN